MNPLKRFISKRRQRLTQIREVNRQELFLKIRDIIATQLEIDKENITPEKKLIDELNIDSLDTIELVMALEEEFGIEIPDEDAEKILTVKDMVDYIEKKISQE